MNPVPWLQMTNMISYQGLVRTFPKLREIHAHKLSIEERYDYHDIWGVHNALDYVFSSLSRQERSELQTARLTYRLN